jgi:hypothetical protein
LASEEVLNLYLSQPDGPPAQELGQLRDHFNLGLRLSALAPDEVYLLGGSLGEGDQYLVYPLLLDHPLDVLDAT